VGLSRKAAGIDDGVDYVYVVLSPGFPAGALAIFKPWRGGRRIRPALGMAPALMACGIEGGAYCLASYGVLAAGTRCRRSLWIGAGVFLT
jgi:hypothetical protein